MKKYRNPLKDCGMYRKNILFYFWRLEARPCPRYIHGIPLSGDTQHIVPLSPDSLSMGKLYKMK